MTIRSRTTAHQPYQLLIALCTMAADYGVVNPIDYLVEVLLKEAMIPIAVMPVNCKIKACGVRGDNFFTLFIDAPTTAIYHLTAWLNHFFPTLHAYSLDDILFDDELAKPTKNVFTEISLRHTASITMDANTFELSVLLLLHNHLINDPIAINKFKIIKALEKIAIDIANEQEKYKTSVTNEVLKQLNELITQLKCFGLEKNKPSLKADLQNLVNALENLQFLLLAKNNLRFFSTEKIYRPSEETLQTLEKTLREICNIANIQILFHNEQTSEPRASASVMTP